jgi:hypothetical protein
MITPNAKFILLLATIISSQLNLLVTYFHVIEDITHGWRYYYSIT